MGRHHLSANRKIARNYHLHNRKSSHLLVWHRKHQLRLVVRRAQQLHGMGKSSTDVLGKFLSAAVYMSAALKEESGEISFALHSNGLGKQI
ncbi:MAG: Hsp33 family molecular chaperone HslO, partial [Rikenellaceae bacterium]|nr:Hsp33 family molecular chaperone HslO [Rikenellaceae bacterium]